MEQDIKELLLEIRDNQRVALERQQQQLEVAREQMERAKVQIAESMKLQREAVERARTAGRVALPLLVVCLLLVGYLIVRYF